MFLRYRSIAVLSLFFFSTLSHALPTPSIVGIWAQLSAANPEILWTFHSDGTVTTRSNIVSSNTGFSELSWRRVEQGYIVKSSHPELTHKFQLNIIADVTGGTVSYMKDNKRVIGQFGAERISLKKCQTVANSRRNDTRTNDTCAANPGELSELDLTEKLLRLF